MVVTGSSRSSSRPANNHSPVDNNMEDVVDKREETQENNGVVEEKTEKDLKDENVDEKDKNDIGCKQCLEEGEPIVETREVETEYDKPKQLVNYMTGFIKRVIICSLFIMLCKTAWPRIQPVVWPEVPTKDGKLYILNDRSFRGHVSRGDHFVMMMAPWCGHCKKLKPDWEKLARLPGVTGLSVSKVDCTSNKLTCDKYEVKSYPTLFYFRDGKMIEKYSGANDLQSLREFVKTKKSSAPSNQQAVKDKKHKTKKSAEKKEL